MLVYLLALQTGKVSARLIHVNLMLVGCNEGLAAAAACLFTCGPSVASHVWGAVGNQPACAEMHLVPRTICCLSDEC